MLRLLPFLLSAVAIDTAHFLMLKIRIISFAPNNDVRHKLTHTFGRSDYSDPQLALRHQNISIRRHIVIYRFSSTSMDLRRTGF
jgi:hypothetical protein